MEKADLAEKYFLEGYACAQSVLMAYAEELNLNLETAKLISSTFGAGMGRLRKTCGVLTGAFMVLGLKYGNSEPNDMTKKLDSYEKVRELARLFGEKYGSTECRELLIKFCDTKSVEERSHHKKICCSLVHSSVEMLEKIIKEKDQSK